ncbi:MAG: glycosyltransferase family A protein [Bacteroidales bacterium]|nr:glycosyltransferase family A protein [Bacteroidales bacterium]
MFSIIIPLYNKAHTIKRTLDSVLNQTFTNYEIIIINDGSTDNSVSFIKSNFNDARIRIIEQENKGVSGARNRGISEAKNEYIAFLDGDDEWLPEYLEFMVKTSLEYPDAGLLLCGRYTQNIQTGERKSSVPAAYAGKIKQIEFFHNPHVFAHISATVVKRELIANHISSWGGFIEGQKFNEDFVFLFRVALHTKTAYCGFPLAIYNGNVEGQATSSNLTERKVKDSLLFHNVVIAEWIATQRRNLYFKIFMKYELRHIFLLKLKNEKKEENRDFIKSLDSNYKKIFPAIEWTLYTKTGLKKLVIYYIMFTKLIWRLRNYPRIV